MKNSQITTLAKIKFAGRLVVAAAAGAVTGVVVLKTAETVSNEMFALRFEEAMKQD